MRPSGPRSSRSKLLLRLITEFNWSDYVIAAILVAANYIFISAVTGTWPIEYGYIRLLLDF